MNNQSELDNDIEMLLLRVHNGDYDRNASQTIADVKKRIVSLITANYTPNSEVEKQVREAELTFVARSADYYKQWESELTKGEE